MVVEDFASLGGFTLVHQFCSIGAHSFTAMNSVIPKDVPPYILVSGHMAKPYGLNVEGLKRRNFSTETIELLRKAYKIIYRSNNTLQSARTQLDELRKQCPEVGVFVDFLDKSRRGIVR